MPRTQQVRFESATGLALDGRLHIPDGGSATAYALFAHCFTCSKDSVAASRISRALGERGIAVLRFDFTGLGGSDGDFGNTDFSSNIADLISAADFLRKEYLAPELLIGHSLGGAAVLAAAAQIPEANAVATIGAPADPAHVKHLFAGGTQIVDSDGFEVELGGRQFHISRQFMDDIETHRLADVVAGLRKAILIMHAPGDSTVPIANAQVLFEAARHPKSFISLDNADHLISKKADAAYVAEAIGGWAGRYISLAVPEVVTAAADIEADAVIVEDTPDGKFTQRVRAGRHTLAADEPLAVGGDDTGLSPYDFLLAGLGSCTSMTIRMYADRKAIPLSGVKVRLRHDKIHAEDCERCETESGRVDHIVREITLQGSLSGEQRERLLEIADRCPVHRTLTSEIHIETELVG